MATPSTRTSAQGVLKFTIFVDPSFFIITIYLVCLINAWEKNKILNKWCICTIGLKWPHSRTRTTTLGVLKFTILVESSLIIIIIFTSSEPCPRVKKKIFWEIHKFYTLYLKITFALDGGHKIYNFVTLHTAQGHNSDT